MTLSPEDIDRVAKASGDEIATRLLLEGLGRLALEESIAYEKYNRLSVQADAMGHHVAAMELRSIALDENRHRETLAGILRRL